MAIFDKPSDPDKKSHTLTLYSLSKVSQPLNPLPQGERKFANSLLVLTKKFFSKIQSGYYYYRGIVDFL